MIFCTDVMRRCSSLRLPWISVSKKRPTVETSPLSMWTFCWPDSSGGRWRRRSKVSQSPNQASELRGASRAPTAPCTRPLAAPDSNTGGKHGSRSIFILQWFPSGGGSGLFSSLDVRRLLFTLCDSIWGSLQKRPHSVSTHEEQC